MAKFRNFDQAEEALQEALASAFTHWNRNGIPHSPAAWLHAPSRKAIDRLRKARRDEGLSQDIVLLSQGDVVAESHGVTDQRLSLIFTCCHPALEPKSSIALTLRTLGGLTTTEIANAFLDAETTLGQRLSRAKAKIAQAGIPFRVPEPQDWDERLNSVLKVIYLIFNEGYCASSGASSVRVDLCEEAIYLARMIEALRPDEPEVLGVLALMLFAHARYRARIAGAGVVPLEAQDRLLWDQAKLKEAEACLDRALALRKTGPYQIQAAIMALHSQAAARDWGQILMLYDALITFDANPVIRLNRAVALAEAGFLELALQELTTLEGALTMYQPYFAAKADLLRKAGHEAAAQTAYAQAIGLARNAADVAWLQRQKSAAT
ncbi:sigma-70, region 4 family protein [Asticcacaulis biprosthecium C19]|uniref:Sigma-70, region 4 family protein n=1 Tax=Asticcacaulis biprosthecium C19 TaxID=715226 RepID=F4QRK4_9CAUL|nr:DUF6596 domain-containing protein [Asticcacaulis biprosthecium]EGF90130.1 sigma-70, region 4 family protein [Asticcacaulis biprosthecium C19]